MIISLNWIKEYVNLDGISVEELVKRFGLSTAEVEGVEYRGQDIDKVVTAEILNVQNHPNSTHLHILKVNDGSGKPVQVVCGAPNVRVGLKTYFAQVGANVRGNKIKPAKLAGVESQGMCCGGNELGIEADTSGIVELPENTPVGVDIKQMLPVEDVLIEVDNKSLTNRPDLWGHYGIAREFAAIFKRELKPLKTHDVSVYNNLKPVEIKVETPNCFRYCGITVENITKKVSSPVMKLRLNYCGMRDINLLADLTNYVMLELGQPMHAFDNEIVKGITVIETNKNLDMLTLEGATHTIEPGSLVICDTNREPVAVAGIKGGLKSGITEQTNSLLIESACFDCVAIRKTSRKIGLVTDASLRYEKSLDPEMCLTAIERLLCLLKEIDAGAKVSSSLKDVYNYHYPAHTIVIDEDFISRRGGVKLTTAQIAEVLTYLGFGVKVKGKNINVEVPSWRNTKDVSIKEDLVEEVFRMFGYDNIKSETMSMPLLPASKIATHEVEYQIKYALASLFNLNEVHSYVWNYADFNKQVGIEQKSVLQLMDSSKSGQSGLRTELAPTLIKIASENTNKFASLGIFEIGRVWDAVDKNNLAVEKKKLSIVLATSEQDEKTIYFKLKQMVEYITCHITHTQVEFVLGCSNPIYHPVNSCQIMSAQTVVGQMGLLHPSIASNIDKRKSWACLELDVNCLIEQVRTTTTIQPVSKYQSISLDFNFLADKTLPYGEIEKAINNFKCSYILEHSLKDIYENDQVLNGKISYTINLIITPKNKTLEGADIEKFSKRFIQTMEQIGLKLRN